MVKTAQGAALDRKKLMADPIMVTTIVVLITFLTLFILYPLAILLVDSVYSDGSVTLSIFKRVLAMPTFTRAITNTLKVGFVVGILSTLIGLLFAYVEVYVRMKKVVGGLFKVVSMLPVVSPPFVLSLSMIMLFGKAGLITEGPVEEHRPVVGGGGPGHGRYPHEGVHQRHPAPAPSRPRQRLFGHLHRVHRRLRQPHAHRRQL